MAAIAERRRRKLDQDLERAEAGLPPKIPLPQANDVFRLRQEIRFKEIREVLLKLDTGHRDAELRIAAINGDRETLLAVQEAPTIMRNKLVHQDVQEEVRQKYYELHMSDQWQAVKTVMSAIGTFKYNVKVAEEFIAKAAGVPLAGDLAAVAVG